MPDAGKHGTSATRGTNKRPNVSRGSQASHQEGFIPPHGGYANLHGYRKSEIIYRATKVFCDRFISIRSRTHDQMVQAARSGNKNIAEASQVSGTSKESEIDRQLRRLEQDFLKEGGLRERTRHGVAFRRRRMTRARLNARDLRRGPP